MNFLHEGLARVPVVSGLVDDVRVQFPSEPLLGVEKAVSDGLVRALDDESLDLYEVMCRRDYSPLCPEGEHLRISAAVAWAFYSLCQIAGWADTGDGNTCTASWTHRSRDFSKAGLTTRNSDSLLQTLVDRNSRWVSLHL